MLSLDFIKTQTIKFYKEEYDKYLKDKENYNTYDTTKRFFGIIDSEDTFYKKIKRKPEQPLGDKF